MKILLIISFLIPLIYIWRLISTLDELLPGNEMPIPSSGKAANAIVLGTSDLAKKTAGLLEGEGFRVIRLTDPFQLAEERKLCYLFALSESDADNIAFYKLGKKLYCIENLISVCNDKKNENMFMCENISYLLAEKASAVELVHIVLQAEVSYEHKYE